MTMNRGLTLTDVGKRFGDAWILRNIRASVPEGKITAFIGPNGAGKTTLFHVITGSLIPDEGNIALNGKEITGQPAHRIARLGIGRQFQDARIFGSLSVQDNVVAALVPLEQRDSWKCSILTKKRNRAMDGYASTVDQWLLRVGLSDERDKPARELSFGQQKLLSLARLFAQETSILLLDEPTAGLSTPMVETVCDLIRCVVSERGATVAMIEHDMTVVANLAYWIHFMHEGRVAFSGKSEHVLGNRSVRELYMGL